MSFRDAARIAALEARVIELVARLEQLERAQQAKVESDARQRVVATTRKGRR
jgi:hypothetical protein